MKTIFIKSKNYNGFNVKQLIEHLKTLPKNKKVLINTSDNDCPLNIIQDSYQEKNAILLNNFYREEFKK
tara:strand:- start:719 stop:925 length:207 start_codon:yes stop_codon:yes gene_type:complete